MSYYIAKEDVREEDMTTRYLLSTPPSMDLECQPHYSSSLRAMQHSIL